MFYVMYLTGMSTSMSLLPSIMVLQAADCVWLPNFVLDLHEWVKMSAAACLYFSFDAEHRVPMRW